MTTRSQILSAIRTRLATVTVSNGYAFDLGLNSLYRNNGLPIEFTKPLSLSWEDNQDSASTENQAVSIDLPIVFNVVYQVASGEQPVDKIAAIVSDLYKMVKVDPTWGLSQVRSFRGSVESDLDGSNGKLFALVSVTIQINYYSRLWEF